MANKSMRLLLLGVDSILFVNRYGYMIDNIILLITGTLHQRQISELRKKCHPLGSFEEMESVNIAATPAELYEAVLVDTPLGTRNYRIMHTSYLNPTTAITC